MKDELMECILLPIAVYLGVSFWAVVFGLLTALTAYNDECGHNKSRLRKFFPAYEIGCWLGEAPK
jgi:hypothetical protein